MLNNENSSCYIDDLRVSRNNSSATFIKFTESHSFFSSRIFCFYEGEDGKYYNSRVKAISNSDIIPLKVGNKNEVIKIWKRISFDNNYKNVSKMFFIDRDMDEEPSEKDENIYITPCYSVENLYVSRQCFINILESEFSISACSVDYNKCLELFDRLLLQFNSLILELNILIKIRNMKKISFSLNKIKTKRLFSIDNYNILKSNNYEDEIKILKDVLDFTCEDYDSAKRYILGKHPSENFFRGKNQLDFFCEIINYLKMLHRNEEFFDEKNSSVNINISNNRLSELSVYANTPECLRDFIVQHQLH